MQTAASESQPSRTTVSPLPTKTDQRTLFYASRKQGHSILASSRIAGISRATGMRWHKASQASQAEQEARRAVLVTKMELASVQSELVRSSEVDPRDRIAAGQALARMMGYDAPTRTESIVIHASVAQYLEAKRLELAAAQPAHAKRLEPGEPPKQALAESFSPSPNISKKLESEGGK